MAHCAEQRLTNKMAIELKILRLALVKEFCTCPSLNYVEGLKRLREVKRVLKSFLESNNPQRFPVKGINAGELNRLSKSRKP